MVTIGDLAVELGISKATVSYALNNKPGVSAETRSKVLALAEKSGYRHRGRKTSRPTKTAIIGAVLSGTSSDASPNYYVTELLVGAEEACRAAGYTLMVSAWDGSPVPEAFRAAGVVGVLYLGGSFDLSAIELSEIPKVLVGTAPSTGSCDAVLADNYQGAYLATAHLIEGGRRRPCFINGPSTTATSQSKLTGFLAAVRAAGIAESECTVVSGDFTLDSGYELTRQVFSGDAPRPDSVFVADDPMALGCLRALDDLGLDVPGEVAVVGFGDSLAGRSSRPTLSTVEVFQTQLGAIGARFLIERITGTNGPQQRILVAPRLVVRESSG